MMMTRGIHPFLEPRAMDDWIGLDRIGMEWILHGSFGPSSFQSPAKTPPQPHTESFLITAIMSTYAGSTFIQNTGPVPVLAHDAGTKPNVQVAVGWWCPRGSDGRRGG